MVTKTRIEQWMEIMKQLTAFFETMPTDDDFASHIQALEYMRNYFISKRFVKSTPDNFLVLARIRRDVNLSAAELSANVDEQIHLYFHNIVEEQAAKV